MSNNEPHFLTNRELIRDMHTKINSMHNVIYGDEKAGIPGVSQRVNKLEEKDKRRTGIYILISAIAAGISLGLKFIADQFNKL